jgi:hypothetical protein
MSLSRFLMETVRTANRSAPAPASVAASEQSAGTGSIILADRATGWGFSREAARSENPTPIDAMGDRDNQPGDNKAREGSRWGRVQFPSHRAIEKMRAVSIVA